MKKILILTIILLLTGCNNYTELNDLAIIKSIGISKDDNYTLYAEIINKVDKENIPEKKIYEIKAKKIDELFTNIKTMVNKEIHLSHIDLIILNNKLDKKDLENIIKYFINHQELRNDFLVVISSKIKEVLTNSKYDEIEKIIITNKESKNIIKINFDEVIDKYLNNKPFKLSEIIYNNEIVFNGNYLYNNGKFERITNEKNWT